MPGNQASCCGPWLCDSGLPGRLAGSRGLSGVVSGAHAGSSSRLKAIGLSNESGEVRPDAFATVLLSGLCLRHCALHCSPGAEEDRPALEFSGSAVGVVSCDSQAAYCSVLDMFESLASLVPLGRLHRRPLQRGLRDRWSPISLSWDHPVELGQWWSAAVRRWYNAAWPLQGVSVSLSPPSAHLFSDASMQGWGALLDAQVSFGCGSQLSSAFTSTCWRWKQFVWLFWLSSRLLGDLMFSFEPTTRW